MLVQKKTPQLVDLSADKAIGTQATLSLRIGSPVTVNNFYGDKTETLEKFVQECESILNDDLNKDDLNTGRSRLENLILNYRESQ